MRELSGCDLSPGKRSCELNGRVYSINISKIKSNAAIYVMGDITESARAGEQLRELVAQDSLTGIRNRRWFYDNLEEYNTGVFAIFDLDNFKTVNDTYGHAEGDRVLRAFGQALEHEFAGDMTCRYGGEEFALFVPEGELREVYNRVEKLRAALFAADPTIKFTFSAGMSMYNRERSAESILEADKKLYEAKERGRNLTLY